MQYIMSMAPGASTIFFNSIQDAFVDSFNWLSSEGKWKEKERVGSKEDSVGEGGDRACF